MEGSILVVDDQNINRMLMRTILEEHDYQVDEAADGQTALDKLRGAPCDVVLLDLLMPHIDGFEVLRQIKADARLRLIPVIVVSAIDEMDSVVGCIEMGATDHLPKPCDPVLLRARVNASLVSKRLYDMERAYTEQLSQEREKSELLLLNILPAAIAADLKQGKTALAESFPDVTVLFADLSGFTPFVASHTPAEMLDLLNTVFMAFDQLADQYQVEKIKNIGDAYMVTANLPLPSPTHLEDLANLAIDMHAERARLSASRQIPAFQVRVGLHCGPVVAGVIGRRKFAYDLLGGTVNIASRLNNQADAGRTLVAQQLYERLNDRFRFEDNGRIPLKGLGEVNTYWLAGRKG